MMHASAKPWLSPCMKLQSDIFWSLTSGGLEINKYKYVEVEEHRYASFQTRQCFDVCILFSTGMYVWLTAKVSTCCKVYTRLIPCQIQQALCIQNFLLSNAVNPNQHRVYPNMHHWLCTAYAPLSGRKFFMFTINSECFFRNDSCIGNLSLQRGSVAAVSWNVYAS